MDSSFLLFTDVGVENRVLFWESLAWVAADPGVGLVVETVAMDDEVELVVAVVGDLQIPGVGGSRPALIRWPSISLVFSFIEID